MPLDTRRDTKVIAVVFGDLPDSPTLVTGASGIPAVRTALDRVNRLFEPAVAEPFSVTPDGRIDGVLRDPAQTPLLLSVLRESLAPALLRAGVGLGPAAAMRQGLDAYTNSRHALALVVRDGGLTRYVGAGEAGDVLLSAVCRLVDPLLRSRTPKQWEAIAAYRELGHQREVAVRLGVTRQSVGDRLAAGHRRAVEDADAAVAAYLSYLQRRRGAF
jgi:hypothetical protein